MIMAWNLTPVKAAPSAVKFTLAEIPPDVKDSVDEAFDYVEANPSECLVVTFEDQATADLNKAYIRSYCEARPVRLTASIWSGFAEVSETGEVGAFKQTATETAKTPALSLSFAKYVKRSRADSAANGQTEAPSTVATAPVA